MDPLKSLQTAGKGPQVKSGKSCGLWVPHEDIHSSDSCPAETEPTIVNISNWIVSLLFVFSQCLRDRGLMDF